MASAALQQAGAKLEHLRAEMPVEMNIARSSPRKEELSCPAAQVSKLPSSSTWPKTRNKAA
eukprot:11165554-Lingulodinium_polyedra.AAC.1